MKKIIATLGIIVGITALIFLITIQKTPTVQEQKVTATIFPLYDIVRNIAGNNIKTDLLLKPGASPHTYDPSPEDIKTLSQSRELFAIGHGIDDWAIQLANAESVKTVIVDKNVKLLDLKEEESKNQDPKINIKGSSTVDPHYWLSIPNATGIAEQVRDELSQQFPEYSLQIEQNFNEYQLKLVDLNNQINTEIQKMNNPQIATFHNAWSYFARDHGINIVTTFEEFPGEEPTPTYLQQFQMQMKENNITMIFAEPQFSTNSLEPITNDLGVLIGTLDPLGGVEGRNSFVELLQFNISQITHGK